MDNPTENQTNVLGNEQPLIDIFYFSSTENCLSSRVSPPK